MITENRCIFLDVIFRDTGQIVIVESKVVVDAEVAKAVIATRFDGLICTEDGVMFECHFIRFIEIRPVGPWMKFLRFLADWLRRL